MGIIILLPLFALMYWMVMRPQRKMAQEHKEMMAALEEGDEILTTSGIYGVVTEFDGPTVFMEISDGIEVKVSKAAISKIVNYDEALEDDDADDAESSKGPIS